MILQQFAVNRLTTSTISSHCPLMTGHRSAVIVYYISVLYPSFNGSPPDRNRHFCLKKNRLFPSGRSQKLKNLGFELPNSTKRCTYRGLNVTKLSKRILPMRILVIFVVKHKRNHHPRSAGTHYHIFAIMSFCYQMICFDEFSDSSQLSIKPTEY